MIKRIKTTFLELSKTPSINRYAPQQKGRSAKCYTKKKLSFFQRLVVLEFLFHFRQVLVCCLLILQTEQIWKLAGNRPTYIYRREESGREDSRVIPTFKNRPFKTYNTSRKQITNNQLTLKYPKKPIIRRLNGGPPIVASILNFSQSSLPPSFIYKTSA